MTHDPNRKIPNLDEGEPDEGQATLVADTSSLSLEIAVPPPAQSRPQVGIPRAPTPMGVPLAPGSRPQIPGIPSAPGSQPALGRNVPMPGSSPAMGGARPPVPMPGSPFGQAVPPAPGSRPQMSPGSRPNVEAPESELDSTSPTQTSQNLIDASRPKMSAKKTQYGIAPPVPFQAPSAPPQSPPSQPQTQPMNSPSAGHQVAFSPQPHGLPQPALPPQGTSPGMLAQAHTLPLHEQPGFRPAQSTANEFPPQVPGAFPQPQGPDGAPLPPFPAHTPAPPSYGMVPPQVDPRFVPSQVRTQPPPAFHGQDFPQGYSPGQPAPGQHAGFAHVPISPMAGGDTVPPPFHSPGDSEPPTIARGMDDDLRAAIQASKDKLAPISHVNPLGKTLPLNAVNPFALPPGIQPPSQGMPLPPPPNMQHSPFPGGAPPNYQPAPYESDMDQTATAHSADHFSHQQNVGYPQHQAPQQGQAIQPGSQGMPGFAPPPPNGFDPPQDTFSPQAEAGLGSFSAPPHDATLQKKKFMVAGISALIALLVGVIGIVAWSKLSAKEDVPPIASTKGSSKPPVKKDPVPVEPVATVEPAATIEPTKAVDPPQEIPAPREPIAAAEPTPVEKPVPAEKPEPVKPVTRPTQPVVTQTQTNRPVLPIGKPVVSAKDGFNGAVAKASLQSQTSYFAICNKGGPTGAGRAAVTFGNDGKVSGVSMSPPFAGTPTGDCIAKRLQRASTSPFTSGSG
nr:hypothetical protein [Polyangiaceae bacterium]